MTTPEFLARFAKQTKTGGQWRVTCPGHEDRVESLAVREGDGGKIVLFCHAGCSKDRILAAMNLTDTDLFPPSSSDASRRREVAAYDYKDEQGDLLYQAVRFEPKDFRQRRPDGTGGYVWNLNGVRRVPFRLDELRGKEAVVVAEGEKDVNALWALGIPATCNVGGAGKWRDEFGALLLTAGVKRIRIIPDNDAPGLAHAHQVAHSCVAAGLEARLVSLPDVPEKGDVSDYLAAHTKDELTALLKAAPPYAPVTVTQASPHPNGHGLEFTALGDLLAEPDETVDWLVADRIPCGSLVLLAGKPKAGKSTLARDLALQVAKGGRWLGWSCSAGPVWYLAFEDKRSEVKKHFRAMGAGPDDPVRFLFKQPGDNLLAELHTLAERERPALIIVDTLQRLIRARDLNDYAEVTSKLTPVLTLARETHATLLLVHHAGKGDRVGIDAVLGSTALSGSVDNILLFGRSERYRVLSSQQRIGHDLPQTVVLFDEQTGRVSSGQPREQADLELMKAEMLAVLRESQEPMSEPQLCQEVEGRTPIKRAALRAMVGCEVLRTGPGKRQAPFLYSCSLVPAYIREQENKKPEIAKQPDKHWSDSCSQKSTFFETGGRASEQESGPGNVLPELAAGARERFKL